MHAINQKELHEFCEKHSGVCEVQYDLAPSREESQVAKPADVQKTYPRAETVGNFTVFSVEGNCDRLMVDSVDLALTPETI